MGLTAAASLLTDVAVEAAGVLRGFDAGGVVGACDLTRLCDWSHGRGRLARAEARSEREGRGADLPSSTATASQRSDIAKEVLRKVIVDECAFVRMQESNGV